ncbi:hypothetical protein [Psychrobacter pygoscelis]|uniref:hypothetical protein n=1 Tax=Psychrobacter pygoscelis TaxID=2488563 RepID=UPI001039E980|nr:hypothetical protein [Psychrobacter pygoscelis]
MKASNFEIFYKPFTSNKSVIAIPELWNTLDWDDGCFTKNILPYVESQFDSETYANDEFLMIKDIQFFRSMKKCGFYAIYNFIPDKISLSYDSSICKPLIMDDVLENLIFIGWNPRMETGSAFTDGLYPIYLESGISGRLCFDESISIKVNRFGLLDCFTDSEAICKINNECPKNEDFWYPTGLYVDKYTYSFISQYKPVC